MRTRIFAILIAILALAALVAAQTARPTIRFAAYDLLIDTNYKPLGAYQVRIESTTANIKLVGVEGGVKGTAFADPPTYDPRALNTNADGEFGDRIILAAYTLKAEQMPNQPFQIARIHVQITGGTGSQEPMWSLTLDAAADAQGKRITPTIQLVPTGDTP